MSYILEALKKAQAERQLGNAPTIHAQQVVPVAPARAAGGRKPLLAGLGAGALVVAAGALFVWRQAPTAAPPARRDAARTPATVPTRAPDALQVSAPPAPAPARVAEPPVAPAPQGPAVPASVAQTAAAPASAPGRVAEPASARPAPSAPAVPAPAVPAQASAAPARVAEPAAARPAPAAQAAAKPAPEDSLPFLQQLPDAQQREIPRVTFGGYMYSANPADRLLLVDKTLRHEGEEVAPGLVLEKLLPKAAVMNYRGLRYRVVY
jgi:general secretion pathway protein B